MPDSNEATAQAALLKKIQESSKKVKSAYDALDKVRGTDDEKDARRKFEDSVNEADNLGKQWKKTPAHTDMARKLDADKAVSDDVSAIETGMQHAAENEGSEPTPAANFMGYSKGGPVKSVSGPKPKNGDDGMISAKKGEFVVRKSAVEKLGSAAMKKINEGRIPGRSSEAKRRSVLFDHKKD